MLAVHDEDEKLFQAIRSGARGYLPKSIRSRDMVNLLRGAMRGEAAITPAVAGRMLEEFRRLSQPQMRKNSISETAVLTIREQEVLSLVAACATDQEIADELCISVHTVKSHMRNILAKLQLRCRHEAALFAMRAGLISPPNGDPQAIN
jgi:DNA-binding NarL/FixJ family response regulator